jgi:hypothetical protein
MESGCIGSTYLFAYIYISLKEKSASSVKASEYRLVHVHVNGVTPCLQTVATSGPIVHAPDDRCLWSASVV